MILGNLIGLAIATVYASLVEYLFHRFAMHQPGLGKDRWFYVDHAFRHHRDGRNDINISMPLSNVLIGATPMFIGCIWLGWPFALIVAVFACLYSFAWTAMHTAHHDLGHAWVKRVPFYNVWRKHHLQHHDRPDRCFGTIFIWTDRLFRTG